MTGSGVPERLLAIMQCPACGGSLRDVADPPSLVCTECGLRYPVREGIPVMLEEEATPSGEGDPGAGQGAEVPSRP